MKRLFTFGCSFTQYWRWPTWADALGREYSFFENWGVCGGGNSLILNSLIECNQRHSIGPDDSVYIMWTNTSREDRYVGDRWLAQGNIYWTAGSEIPEEYIKKFTCERGYLIRDLVNITAAKHILEKLGCRWKFMSMVPLTNTNLATDLGSNPADSIGTDQDVRNLYKDSLNTILPSVYETLFHCDWRSRPGIADSYDPSRRDFHPTPLEHLEYFDSVCPGEITRQDTRDWMARYEQQAKSGPVKWNTNLPITRL